MRKALIAVVVGLGMTACLTASAAQITVVDVTSASASGNGQNVNGADFNYANPQPTGTGFIDPFLREQNTGSEIGVNTSIKGQVVQNTILYDNKDPVNYTHDLLASTVGTVNNGKDWRFFLDANQVGNGPISLTTFKIFLSATAFTDATALGNFLSSATPVFNMNGGNKTYRVDIASDNGSGSGDMFVDVPVATGGAYLYLVAGFGVDSAGNGFASNDGFEEWWTRTSTPPPPGAPDSASALGLLGLALTGIEVFRRKLRA